MAETEGSEDRPSALDDQIYEDLMRAKRIATRAVGARSGSPIANAAAMTAAYWTIREGRKTVVYP